MKKVKKIPSINITNNDLLLKVLDRMVKEKGSFSDSDFVVLYPNSFKSIVMIVKKISEAVTDKKNEKITTRYLSLKNIVFKYGSEYRKGDLLKVMLEIPNYWALKCRFVDYSVASVPNFMTCIVRVLGDFSCSLDCNKALTFVEIVGIDSVDQKIVKIFLENRQ